MSFAFTFRRAVAPSVFRTLGIDIFGKRDWLQQAAQWGPEKRSEWRLRQLNALLEHCWKQVPFYREFWADHGVRRVPLRSLDELSSYPLVPRDLFKKQRDRLIADNLNEIPHKTDSTGGTTGSPLRYFQDLELHSLRYGCQILGWGFAGYEFGDEVFVAAGGSLIKGKGTLRNKARSWLEAKTGLHCLQMDDQLARECWQVMQRQRTKFIVGYPSTISLLCSSLQRQGRRIHGLKAVITTAEMLLPQYRRTIEEYTGVQVFDHYGCNDGGLLSYECEKHEGLHYNDLECVLNVMQPDANGIGELAITNLWNRSMPFVRYLNGDLVALADSPCTCGRHFPRIGRVNGRTGDILSFPNGKNLTGPGVTLIFKDLPVEAWQAVQTGSNELEIRLCAKAPLSDRHEQHVLKVLREHLTDDCRVTFRYVNTLSVSRGGKLKPVFSEWQRPAATDSPLLT